MILKKIVQGGKAIFKTKFSKLFIFINLLAVFIISPLAMVRSGTAYEESFITSIAECIPLYVIAVVIILVFFMYKPKACSLLVLPIAYLLLIPLYILILYLFGPLLSKSIGIDTWASFYATRIIHFYAFPLIAITLGLAIYLARYFTMPKGESVPFLLQLREFKPRRKVTIILVSIIVMVVTEYVLFAIATM